MQALLGNVVYVANSKKTVYLSHVRTDNFKLVSTTLYTGSF